MAIEDLETLMRHGYHVELGVDGEATAIAPGTSEYALKESQLQNAHLREEVVRLRALLNTPETEDFDKAVPLEAAHQVQRWGSEHDDGKKPEDWFWLLGYLAGKILASLKAGDANKAQHHCISSAAALRNWHAHIRSGKSTMRPGISGQATAAIDGQHVEVAK